MIPLVLLDTRIYVSGADLSGWSNKVELKNEFEDLDRTTFGDGGAHTRVAGVADSSCAISGFTEAGDLSKPDDVFFSRLGQHTAVTIAPDLAPVGALCYLGKMSNFDWTPVSGDQGKLNAWDTTMSGSQPLARGQILHPNGTARTVTGTGVATQLGAVTAAQRLYANLHTFGVAGTGGPTIAVKVQSSVDNTFAAPTDRITFTTALALGGEPLNVLGPITDTWWRAQWTITGTTPSFLFAVSAGITNR